MQQLVILLAALCGVGCSSQAT